MKNVIFVFYLLMFLAVVSVNAQEDATRITSLVDNLNTETDPAAKIESYRQELDVIITTREEKARFLFFGPAPGDMTDLYNLQTLLSRYKIAAAVDACHPFTWQNPTPLDTNALLFTTYAHDVEFKDNTKRVDSTRLGKTLNQLHVLQQHAFQEVFSRQSKSTAEWQSAWKQLATHQEEHWSYFNTSLNAALNAINENICALKANQQQQRLEFLWIEILKQANLVKTDLVRHKNLGK